MFLTVMPDHPKCLELGIVFKSADRLATLRIWNYNKSLLDSVCGAQEIELMLDGSFVWSGVIKRAPGNEYENYVTEINLPVTVGQKTAVLTAQSSAKQPSQQQGPLINASQYNRPPPNSSQVRDSSLNFIKPQFATKLSGQGSQKSAFSQVEAQSVCSSINVTEQAESKQKEDDRRQKGSVPLKPELKMETPSQKAGMERGLVDFQNIDQVQQDKSVIYTGNANDQSQSQMISKKPPKSQGPVLSKDSQISEPTTNHPLSSRSRQDSRGSPLNNCQQLEGTFDNLKLFNITQEGRFQQAERERFL